MSKNKLNFAPSRNTVIVSSLEIGAMFTAESPVKPENIYMKTNNYDTRGNVQCVFLPTGLIYDMSPTREVIPLPVGTNVQITVNQ